MATPPQAANKAASTTRKAFLDAAPEAFAIKLGDLTVQAKCKLFDSDSVGFGFYGRIPMVLKKGKTISLSIENQTIASLFGKKSSGSWGWYLGGKLDLPIGGKSYPFQVTCNVTGVETKTSSAAEFDNDCPKDCMVSLSITAVGSKAENDGKKHPKWDDGGDISAWRKPAKEEVDDNDEEDETPASSSKNGNGKDKSKKSGKPKQLAR